MRSNLTGVSNTRTVPVGKRVEVVCDEKLIGEIKLADQISDAI